MEVVCRSLIAPGLLKTSWQSGQQGKGETVLQINFCFSIHCSLHGKIGNEIF